MNTKKLSQEELISLHDQDYVERFKKKTLGRLKKLLTLMDPLNNTMVADFGCGNGMLLDCLTNTKIKSYAGIDFSTDFIKAARTRERKHIPFKFDFFCEPIESFCSKHPSEFDMGFALDLSEHIYDEEWLTILTHIFNCLKPEGRFYLHTPNADFIVEQMKKHNFIIKQFPEHIAVRNVPENLQLLEKAGFHIENVLLIPHYNVLKILHIFSFFPFIGRFFKARIFIIGKKLKLKDK